MVGEVKSFFRPSGYGFLISDDLPEDIFFHIKHWECSYKPKPGDKVSFAVKHEPDGYRAFKVKRI